MANLADEITYYSHDLDDGLDSGLLTEAQLERDIDCWKNASERIRDEHGDLPEECRHYFIIRCLIDEQVHDVVGTTEANIAEAGVASADDVRQQKNGLVAYSPARREANLQLRAYLYKNLYFSEVVSEPHKRATRLLEGTLPALSGPSRRLGAVCRIHDRRTRSRAQYLRSPRLHERPHRHPRTRTPP